MTNLWQAQMKNADAARDPGERLIQALLQPRAYAHPVGQVRVEETHISWVILTGAFAYKIKKPVSLGFVDFSTLERRRAACLDEVRLNARLASRMYIGVVPICGTPDAPVVDGTGEAIDYAVKMRQFPDDCRLDRFTDQRRLNRELVRNLAVEVARFHNSAPVCQKAQGSEWHFSEIADNFDTVEDIFSGSEHDEVLKALRQWSLDSLVAHGDQFRKRRRDGFVRECHGDMHLANMAYMDDKITVYDALEFNPRFRWIDVMSEVAFVVMDLLHHQRPDLAAVFLSSYLEQSGDYEGLALLRHFLVFRAMVRAKVSALRASQEDANSAARNEALRETAELIELADECRRYGDSPFLLITCGVSGSGKSLLSAELVATLGAVRIRSDVERLRRAVAGRDRYSGAARHRTYGRLESAADKILGAGLPVIVDATFLTRQYRRKFWDLANEHRVPFAIVALNAPRDVLAHRVRRRRAEGKDVSEATERVLERQLKEFQPLTSVEREFAIEIESTEGADLTPVERFLRRSTRLPLNHRMRRYGVLPRELQ